MAKIKRSGDFHSAHVIVDAVARVARDPREQATTNPQIGCAFFARPFNHCDDAEITYCWPKEARAEAERLLAQLIHLAEEGPLRPRAGARAQDDREFQQLMAKLTS